MIRKIADWFSEGGIILIAKIGYVFYWITTILQPIGMLVTYIILASDGFIETGTCIALILLTIPVVTILNIIVLGFMLGYVQWLENVTGPGYRSVKSSYKTTSRVSYAPSQSQTQTGPTAVSTNSFKSEQQEKDKAAKLRQENTNLKEKEVAFTSKYFGKDEKGESVIVDSGSIGKIVKKNPNGTYDLEVMDEGKAKTLTEVQSFYFKF